MGERMGALARRRGGASVMLGGGLWLELRSLCMREEIWRELKTKVISGFDFRDKSDLSLI